MLNSRKLSVVGGILILVGAVILARYIAQPEPEEQPKENRIPRVATSVIQIDTSEITSQINFTGRVVASENVKIFSEVVGILEPTPMPFKTGISFNKGDTLIHINSDEEQEALKAQKYQFAALLSRILPDISLDYPDAYSKWNNYLKNFDADEPVKPLPEISDSNQQLRLFLISNDVFSQFHQIKEQEQRMQKFVIRAPFTGIITESLIDPGTLVRSNQELGTFQRLYGYEIEASVDINQVDLLSVGDRVAIQLDVPSATGFSAQVARINKEVDSETQTVLVYLKTTHRDITSGQFVEGSIGGSSFPGADKLPLKSIVNNNNVFIIRDSVATMQPVQIHAQLGDSLIVSGLEPGTLVIDEFRTAGFEGTKVDPVQ